MDGRLRDLLDAAVGEPPHQVTAAAVRRRVIRRRLVEYVAGAMAVVVIAALALVGVRTLGHTYPPAPATRPHPTAHIITSRHYGYTETLPARWRLLSQATRRWDGTGAPGYDANVVDLYQGPGGVQAWADAAPTTKNLEAYTARIIQQSRAGHPCSPPQTDKAITIGGAPARLISMQCPSGSGFLVEIAVTVHNGTGLVFASQNSTGTAPADQPSDEAAFREFLAGIQLRQ